MQIELDYTAKKLEKLTPTDTSVFGELEKDISYTFSGKSSLALLLRYYYEENILHDRTDQVLVPHWLGTPVYEIMHKTSFPTTAFNEKVRGVLAYHQWGYPQDMDTIKDFCEDNKLFLIEDCAHSFESYYKGQRLGTIGDAALFSLSKFFPSVVGGAIYSKNNSLQDFIKRAFSDHNAALAEAIFDNRLAFDSNPTEQNRLELMKHYIVYDHVSQCPEYSLTVARTEISTGTLERRRSNYKRYVDAFGDEANLSKLVEENVLPWAVPLFLPEKARDGVVTMLRQQGVKSNVYHFDINRNLLNPQFVPCVPLPCHQGMTEQDVDTVITAVKKAIR